MADISAWSPLDESNVAAPPNGWPENQPTNTVNNCARAMMGAIRRWYDTVTAQVATITTQVANALPLTGGTLTGGLTVNSPAGIVTTGGVTAASIYSTGNGAVSANLSVSGIITTGGINATYYDCDGNRVIDTGGGATILYKGGNAQGVLMSNVATYYDNNDHIFRNSGTGNTFTINSAGNVNAVAQVQGASLYSRGNIDGLGNISATGTITAGGVINSPRFQGGPSNAAQLGMYGGSSINFRWYNLGTGQVAYRVDETVEKYIGATVNVLDTQYATGGGGPTGAVFGGHDFPGTWYYCFIDYTSDERIKSNIAPTQVDALGILKQVPVDSFDVRPEVSEVFRSLRGMHGREVPASSDHVAIGLVAQKLQALIPEAVYVGPQPGDNALPEDCHNITLPAITPYLIRAVQQLAARVEALEGSR